MFFLHGDQANWLKPAALPRYLQYLTDGWSDITDSKSTALSTFTPSTVFYIPACLAPNSAQTPAVAYDYITSTIYRFTDLDSIASQRLELDPAERAACCVFRGVEYVLMYSKSTTKLYALSSEQPLRFLDKATMYEKLENFFFVACDSNLYLISHSSKSIKLRGLTPADLTSPLLHLKNISVLMQPLESQRESLTGLKAGVGLSAALKVSKIHYVLPLFNRYITIFYTPESSLTASTEPKKAALLPVHILLIDPVLMSADHVSQEGTVAKLDIMIHKFVSFQQLIVSRVSLDDLKQRAHRLSVTIKRYDEFLETGAVEFLDDYHVRFDSSARDSVAAPDKELNLGVSSIKAAALESNPPPKAVSAGAAAITEDLVSSTPVIGSDSSLFNLARGDPRTSIRPPSAKMTPTREFIAPGAILEASIHQKPSSHASSPAVNNAPALIDVVRRDTPLREQYRAPSMDATMQLAEVQLQSRSLPAGSRYSVGGATPQTTMSLLSPSQIMDTQVQTQTQNQSTDSMMAMIRHLTRLVEAQAGKTRATDDRLSELSQSLVVATETIKRIELENGELRERIIYLEEVHNEAVKGPRPLTHNDLGQLKEEISIYAMTDIVSTFDRLADKVDSDTNSLKAKLSLMIEREINTKVRAALDHDMFVCESKMGELTDQKLSEALSATASTLEALRTEMVTKEVVSKLISNVVETQETRLQELKTDIFTGLEDRLKHLKSSADTCSTELERLRANMRTLENDYNTNLPTHLEVYLKKIADSSIAVEMPKVFQSLFDQVIDEYVRAPGSMSTNPHIKRVEARLGEELMTVKAKLEGEIASLNKEYLNSVAIEAATVQGNAVSEAVMRQLKEQVESQKNMLLQLQIQVGDTAAIAVAANNTANAASTLADGKMAVFKYVVQKLNEDYLPTFAADVTAIVIQRVKDDMESDKATADNRALIEEIVTSSRVINQIEALTTKTYVNLLDKIPGIVTNELTATLPEVINEQIARHLAEEVYSLKNIGFLDTLYTRIAERLTQESRLRDAVVSQVSTNIIQELDRIANIDSPLSPLARFKTGLISQLSAMIKAFMKDYTASSIRPSLLTEVETMVNTVDNTKRSSSALRTTGALTEDFIDRQRQASVGMSETQVLLSKLQTLERRLDLAIDDQTRTFRPSYLEQTAQAQTGSKGISTEIIDEFSKVYLLLEKQKKDAKLIHQVSKALQEKYERLNTAVEVLENKTDKLHHMLFSPQSVRGSNLEMLQARVENTMIKQAKLEGEMRNDVKELKESMVYMDRYLDKLRVRFDLLDNTLESGVDTVAQIKMTTKVDGGADTLTMSQLKGSHPGATIGSSQQGIITTPLVDRLCLFLYAVAKCLQAKMGTKYFGKTILECDKHDIRTVLNVLERSIIDYVSLSA